MQTSDLPQEINKLKSQISTLLLEFNKKAGIDIAEVHVQPLTQKELNNVESVYNYDVHIGIDI